MRTFIIYIPGLGDRYDGFRAAALKSWRLWGVSAVHVPIVWYDGGDMASKMKRIADVIDKAPADAKIVLVGESAGGSLALQTASHDKRVSRVITLCGVARPDTPISNYLRRRAPALDEAVRTLAEDFDADIHSVSAFVDGVVGRRYSVVKGAHQHVVWSVGHLTTIALCLTIFGWYIASIAKK